MPLTRAQRLALIGRPLLHPEHDFLQPRADWERAVFDNADHFLTIDFGVPPNHPERNRRWPTFPLAVEHAATNSRVCIYAVTATERSTIIDRRAWPTWLERWWQRE